MTGSEGEYPIAHPYHYPYGGEEHRHEPAIDDDLPLNPEDAAQMNPLSRPVASWSEDELRRVMASPAYLQPSHPGRARAHAMVREWFAQAEARLPVRIDATGRRVPERATSLSSAGGDCEVPVRAHTRQRGKVEVGAHCRAPASRLSGASVLPPTGRTRQRLASARLLSQTPSASKRTRRGSRPRGFYICSAARRR